LLIGTFLLNNLTEKVVRRILICVCFRNRMEIIEAPETMNRFDAKSRQSEGWRDEGSDRQINK
jgi:hypothetical protein